MWQIGEMFEARDEMSKVQIINGDCMEAMKEMPDKAFELAICDPEYGNKDAIGLVNSNGHCANRKNITFLKTLLRSKNISTN